jgi:ABC-type lipoprotein release transport system permease subunit
MLIRLAWRSIWRNRRRTIITVSSITFGLTIAIFFISMAEGMYEQMIDEVVRMQAGHITLEHPEYREAPAVDLWLKDPSELRARIESLADVDVTKAIVLGQGMAKSGAGNVGAALMGVEPSIEARSSPLVGKMVAGDYLDDGDGRLVVMGSEMAERLNLQVGKKLVLTTNDAQGNLVEELCRVKGIFETGMEEMDGYFIQTPVGFARRLFRMPDGGATQLGVVLKDADVQRTVTRQIRARLNGDPIAVLSWQEVMPEMASFVRMDKGSNIVFQVILIFLILFTIFNTILMSVLERQREFAVLLAIGTRPLQLRLQIFLESFFLGLIGCSLGLLIGGLATYFVGSAEIDMSSLLKEGMEISGFVMKPILRTKMSSEIFLTTAALVFVATLLISVFPMRRAARVPVAELLR